MKFGAHLSISKGLPALLAEVESLGLEAIQVFARNPRGRGETVIPAETAKAFREEITRRGWTVMIHGPYYVNVGSGVARNQRIAKEVAVADLEKGDFIGAEFAIVHFGSPGEGFTVEECTDHAIRTIKAILASTKAKTKLLLESSAGPNRVGGRFEQLAAILKGVGQARRVGVCLDTCHLFVSGYDMRGAGARKVINEFDRLIGLDRLNVIHCNDTQSKLGSGWDRHWHLGQGKIGSECFRTLLQDRRLKDQLFVLETPKEHPKTGANTGDKLNLARLKKWAA